MEKSKLYTRTGDDGTTSLVGGSRVAKNSPRLEAYGTIDELNSWIGLVATFATDTPGPENASLASLMNFISAKLFDIGACLATDPAGPYASMTANPVTTADIVRLEEAIDRLDSSLPRLNSFVLPGGTAEAAQTHIARSVCRRAERRVLAIEPAADPAILRFLNRLSDLLFAAARFFVINAGKDEIFWSKDC